MLVSLLLAFPRIGPAYEFYVSEESSIKVFNSDGGYVRTFATPASAGILQPSQSAFDSMGNLWVSSEGNDRVIQIAPSGEALQTLTDSIRGPEGLILDAAGNIHVANEDDNSIAVFAPNGTLSQLIGNGNSVPISPYPNYPSIYYPHGLALGAAGLLYVANTSENSILKIDLNANPVTRSVFHQFTSTATPVGVAIDSAGYFYVTNFVSNEINKFTPSGAEIRRSDGSAFITTALQPNGWSSNRALTLGPDGSIYVPNEGTGTIGVYNAAGDFVRAFGNGTGAADLRATHYVAIRPDHIWQEDNSGSWPLSSNWSDGAPNAAGDTALFGLAISAPRTVAMDGSRTLGTLVFANSNTYTLAEGTGATLLLDNGETPAHIINSNGSHVIATPVSFTNTGMTVAVTNAGDQLTMSGPVSGSGRVDKSGAGVLLLNAANMNNAFSPTAIDVQGGTLLLGAANQIADTTNLTLSGGAFRTGGFSDSLGVLTLVEDSILDLGSGASVLSFSAGTLDGGTLTIEHWNGSPAGGGADQLRFSSALDTDSLNHIQFADFGSASQIVFNQGHSNEYYEIVPTALTVIPEVVTVFWPLALLGLAGSHERRRLQFSRRRKAGGLDIAAG